MKKHILLVDDDPDEVTFLIPALDQLNISYKCTWANSGEQAITQLAYITPDIIFLDIHLGGISGFECLTHIKKDARLQHIPVILTSAVLSDDQHRAAIRLGAEACIKKQDIATELPSVLERLLFHPDVHP